MEAFNDLCHELIVLSDALYKQNFRICFVDHLLTRIEAFIKLSASQNVDVKVMEKLQLKLLEPVMFHLRKSVTSEDKCVLINYLIKILSLTFIKSDGIFFHLYVLIFSQILDNESMKYQISEELKISVFEAGSFLLSNSDRKMLEKVLKPEFGEKYSIGIYAAVQSAKTEKCIQLRVKALEFLLHASLYKEKINYVSDLYKGLGDVFMLYLPGVVAPLQEIILRDETQNHLITVKALTCWGHVICLVLNDQDTEKKTNLNEVMMQWIESSKKIKDSGQELIDHNKVLSGKKRTKLWLKSASETIAPLILKVTEVNKHSNHKCRLELTNVMIKFHKHCKMNLKSSLNAVLEVLVGSTMDDNDAVKIVAKQYLESVLKHNAIQQQYTIFAIEKNIYSLINQLPSSIRCGDEKLILPRMKSLSGYLKILSESGKLDQIITFLPTLKKLLTVIETGFKIKYYAEISEQYFSSWDDENPLERWPASWKRFEYFSDDSVRQELERICKVLGEQQCADTIIDHLLDAYHENKCRRVEILLIINQIILGCKEMKESSVNQMLDFYLDSENLSVPLQVKDDVNLRNAHSNIIQVALIMEGLNHLAKILKKGFENYIFRTLYIVIERMGSSYCLVSCEAYRAAVEMSSACGLNGNINLLIKKNIDYLSYHSTNRLRRNDPGVFDVLTVLINCSSIDSLPGVEDIVNEVLKNSCKNLNSSFTLSYLRMFQTFVKCARKWAHQKETDVSNSESENKSTEENHIKKLAEDLKKREEEEIKNQEDNATEETEMNEANEEINGSNEETFENEQEEMTVEKVTPPKHIALTISISNHCLNFLASKDKNKKLIVLEVLKESVLILRDWENELLPLVHKIWSPLVTRFEEKYDPLLIRASFHLLCALAETSKQFIRSRTLKNILPSLQLILSKESVKSKFKNSSSGHFFTQGFKLQRELLDNLGGLAANLQIFEKQTDSVIECAMPYLSSSQPKLLQEKCFRFFTQMKSYDPYVVWLKLTPLKDDPEFSKNVRIILN